MPAITLPANERYGMTDDFDMVVMETVKKQHEKARRLLTENRDKLDELANYLYEKETITGNEFMAILNGKDGAAI